MPTQPPNPPSQSPANPRARSLGIPFEGTPGPLNAITDVATVEVGHITLIDGHGPLHVGRGPIRTGVTAIHPRGRDGLDPVFAGFFSLNGAGEMTGTAWIDEAGLFDGPVVLTNTHSVGVARDATLEWLVKRQAQHKRSIPWFLPVAAETWDGRLNDINGFHVKPHHIRAALDEAHPGPIAEGNVGGGTGMICHQFKGGIGTSSRIVSSKTERYTVGALVQANHGLRHQLRIAGLPVGLEIPLADSAAPAESKPPGGLSLVESGSILVILATDAPMLPHQLKALAKRGSLGLGRTGGIAGITSGDLMLAFTTANQKAAAQHANAPATLLGLDHLTPIFEAAAQATEEAIVNALVAAKTMTGINDFTAPALPHDRLQAILKKYNRLSPRR